MKSKFQTEINHGLNYQFFKCITQQLTTVKGMYRVSVSVADAEPDDVKCCVQEQVVVPYMIRVSVSADDVVDITTRQVVFLQTWNFQYVSIKTEVERRDLTSCFF